MKFLLLLFIFGSIYCMESELNSSATIVKIEDKGEQLYEVITTFYLNKINKEVDPDVIKCLKRKIKAAKKNESNRHRSLIAKLSDSTSSEITDDLSDELIEEIYNLISDALMEAYDNKKNQSLILEKRLKASNRRATCMACSNIATALITAAFTAGVTLTIHFTT